MKILNPIWLLAAFILLTLVPLRVYGQSQSPANLPPYRLSAIRILPYNQTTNSFLAEVKKDKDADFFNELDLSLFVTVEVSGQPGSISSNRRVEIIAYEGSRVILKRVVRLGVISESTGKYYVPVWLYSPFCQQVTIKARLIGQRQISTLQRKLDFLCGE